jgi:hypothetical protein
MSSLTISLIALACIFGGTLLGMAFRRLLPDHHLSEDTRDSVKLGIGMIATLTALVLGLLIASAKGTFDTMTNELRQAGAKIILLDRVMAQYGPETQEARDLLRQGVSSTLHRIWPEEEHKVEIQKAIQPGNELEGVQDKIRQLSPRNDSQQWLKARALSVSADIAESRWILLGQLGQSSLPWPFLVVLVCWLTIIFCSFGLFSPRNGTVISVMFICSFSVVVALFLILELDQPYEGFIKISNSPLLKALAFMGK